MGITRDLPLIERYRMVGKLNLGEYHLQIKNVSVEDDDLYECQLSPTDNEKIQISSVAKLTVLGFNIFIFYKLYLTFVLHLFKTIQLI